jgi:hypothetical protein
LSQWPEDSNEWWSEYTRLTMEHQQEQTAKYNRQAERNNTHEWRRLMTIKNDMIITAKEFKDWTQLYEWGELLRPRIDSGEFDMAEAIKFAEALYEQQLRGDRQGNDIPPAWAFVKGEKPPMRRGM